MSDSNSSVPVHIGIILDGNRRWAKDRGLPTFEGHLTGYETLKSIAEKAFDKGVAYVTAFVFSTENWQRSKEEVGYLMNLAYRMINRDLKEMHKKNIRFVWIGSEAGLSDKLIKILKEATETTKNNTRGTLAMCFNYGGKSEIVHAVKKLLNSGVNLEEITEEAIENNLYAPSIPPIDIMVRTSGEQRISNFMLWRVAYSELLFIKKHWPDFNENDLEFVITEYSKRKRRFGG